MAVKYAKTLDLNKKFTRIFVEEGVVFTAEQNERILDKMVNLFFPEVVRSAYERFNEFYRELNEFIEERLEQDEPLTVEKALSAGGFSDASRSDKITVARWLTEHKLLQPHAKSDQYWTKRLEFSQSDNKAEAEEKEDETSDKE